MRLITATHRDLKAWSDEGRFRPDLYYRLSVFTIHLPPLRERDDDLRLLMRYYLPRFSRELGREVHGVDPEALRLLRSYSWPGNIRELQSVLKQAILQSRGTTLLPGSLPPLLGTTPGPARRQIRRRAIPASRRSLAGAWPPLKASFMPKHTARWTGFFWLASWRRRAGTSSGRPDGWGSAGRPCAAGSAKWEST